MDSAPRCAWARDGRTPCRADLDCASGALSNPDADHVLPGNWQAARQRRESISSRLHENRTGASLPGEPRRTV